MKKKTYKKMRSAQGFTLIELLVSSALFITVSVIIISVLFIIFRVSKKTETLLSLRSNGNAAITQMVNGIRYAKSLNDPVSCLTTVTQSSVTITSSSDQGTTTFSCPATAAGTIASNSASLINSSTISVTNCSFSCSQVTTNDPPTITIRFNLQNRTAGPAENTGVVPFQTAVTMRNYSK